MVRGDAVIRPSSLGYDHIAVTWKVSDNIFQHLDVLEIDKPNEFAIGQTLQVGGTYKYSDLDELIVMHVRPWPQSGTDGESRKVLKMAKGQVEEWLRTYTQSNPNRSVYAFCFDHKRAGYFNLMFQTGRNTPIQVWSVKVIPRGYKLMNRDFPEVNDLINGFKKMVTSQLQQQNSRGGNRPGVPGREPDHGARGGDPRYAGHHGGYNNGYGGPSGGYGNRNYGPPPGLATGSGGAPFRDNRDRYDRDPRRGGQYHR